jgi:hypothetical protein
MGVYTNTRITSTSPSERASSVNAFLDSLDRISSELVDSTDPYVYNEISYVGAKTTIDETNIEMFFGNKVDDSTYTIAYVKNGDTFLLGPIAYNYGDTPADIVINVYIDSKCIMLVCNQIGFNGYDIMYVNAKNNKNLIGYNDGRLNVSSSPYVVDISDLKFEDVNDLARIPYSYSEMFPFYAIEGTVDFLNQAYFVNGNGLKSFETDILKECSTVSLFSTVSLPSPLNNHLAFGAHCIVPLDDEEVNE